jgi:hypothetical protein
MLESGVYFFRIQVVKRYFNSERGIVVVWNRKIKRLYQIIQIIDLRE